MTGLGRLILRIDYDMRNCDQVSIKASLVTGVAHKCITAMVCVSCTHLLNTHYHLIFDTMGCKCAFQASALTLLLLGEFTLAAIPKLLTIREDIDTSALAPCKAAKIGIRTQQFSMHLLTT